MDFRTDNSPILVFCHSCGYVLCRENQNQNVDRFRWAHVTLLSTLRSWPGVLHFCHPLKDGLRSIVSTLYLNQLDVRVSMSLVYPQIGIHVRIYRVDLIANRTLNLNLTKDLVDI